MEGKRVCSIADYLNKNYLQLAGARQQRWVQSRWSQTAFEVWNFVQNLMSYEFQNHTKML